MLLRCRDCRCGGAWQPSSDFLQPAAPPQQPSRHHERGLHDPPGSCQSRAFLKGLKRRRSLPTSCSAGGAVISMSIKTGGSHAERKRDSTAEEPGLYLAPDCCSAAGTQLFFAQSMAVMGALEASPRHQLLSDAKLSHAKIKISQLLSGSGFSSMSSSETVSYELVP